MILSGGYAVINKLKAIFKSNTLPLLTADPSVRAANSELCSSAHLHDSLKGKAVASSIIGALRNAFWGKINLFSEVYGVSPSSMTARSIVDTLLPFSTLCLWIFSTKAEQAGGCAGASPWPAEDESKENSIRLSREKKRTYPKREANFLVTLLLLFFSVFLCCSSSRPRGASRITGFVSWHGLMSSLGSECQAGHVPCSSGLLHSEMLSDWIPAFFFFFPFKGFSILDWPGNTCKLWGRQAWGRVCSLG